MCVYGKNKPHPLMGTIDIVFVVLSVVGMVLAVLLGLFVTLQLPEVLRHERDRYPPGTNFAAVHASSVGPVDLMTRPWPLLDGVDLRGGERILLRHQRDKRENGLWVVPLHQTDEWQRAPDLRVSKQLVEGATVYVRHGQEYKDTTFVLRVLLNGPQLPPPGKCDMEFLPLHQHLFGHVPPGRVLRMDEYGRPVWNTREEAEELERSHLTPSPIPQKIHILHGFWNSDSHASNIKAWQNALPHHQLIMWDPRKAEEITQSDGREWLELYQTTKEYPVMRVNVLRAILLYHEGGWCVDMDSTPVTQAASLWTDPGSQRLQLFTEQTFTPNEVDLLNRMPFRQHYGLQAGSPRVVCHAMGCAPHHALLRFWLQHMQQHIPRLNIKAPLNKYDVSFATGEDSLSFVVHKYATDFVDIDMQEAKLSLQHERLCSWEDTLDR